MKARFPLFPHRRLGSVALALILAQFEVLAAFDNFDGYSGSLYGNTGGSSSGSVSWNSGWYDQGFGGSPGIVQNPLGSVNGFGSSSPYAQQTLGATASATRNLGAINNESSVYVYFLIARSGGDNANSFGGVGLYSGTTEQFLIGERFGSGNWGATAAGNLGGSGTDSTVAIGNFTTTLLLAKINQQANTLSLFVNPNFALTEGQNSAAFTINYNSNSDSIDNIRLRGGNDNNGLIWQWDNLNVSLDSPFSAVPEPTTIALGIFGFIGGVGGVWRWQRSRASV